MTRAQEAARVAKGEKIEVSACPSWEEIRMRLYQQHLDVGVKAVFDPKVDPAGFRKAGENALRHIRLTGPTPTEPAPAPQGSGSATGSAQ